MQQRAGRKRHQPQRRGEPSSRPAGKRRGRRYGWHLLPGTIVPDRSPLGDDWPFVPPDPLTGFWCPGEGAGWQQGKCSSGRGGNGTNRRGAEGPPHGRRASAEDGGTAGTYCPARLCRTEVRWGTTGRSSPQTPSPASGLLAEARGGSEGKCSSEQDGNGINRRGEQGNGAATESLPRIVTVHTPSAGGGDGWREGGRPRALHLPRAGPAALCG